MVVQCLSADTTGAVRYSICTFSLHTYIIPISHCTLDFVQHRALMIVSCVPVSRAHILYVYATVLNLDIAMQYRTRTCATFS